MLIYFLPFIAALTGWITNYIAIKMLFHPRKEISILFIKVQGIFPKRKEKLAEKLGHIVANELFSIEDIKSNFGHEHTNEHIRGVIEEKIDTFLNFKLVQVVPMIAMFMNDSLKDQIKQVLIVELENAIPEIIDQFHGKLESTVDVKKIVYEKVVNFSSDKLEDILYSIMKKEFKFIELLGGVLGFLIGLIQLLLVYLSEGV